jgi:hypothetical protein
MYARLCGIAGTGGDTILRGFSPAEIDQFAGYLARVIDNVEAAGVMESRPAT